MTLVVEKFVKKPLYVDVVLVTDENILEAAKWCQGEIRDESDRPLVGAAVYDEDIKKYIHVRVHNPQNPRQTKAFAGDRILYTPQGYKVYTSKAFDNAFEPVLTPTNDVTVGKEGVPADETSVERVQKTVVTE